MNRIFFLITGSLFALASILGILSVEDGSIFTRSNDPNRSLMLYCAASNRAVMDSIRTDYEKEFGRKVEIQYGPSQTLLSSMTVTRSGDLYLPADDSYLRMAGKKQLIAEVLPIARMRAVVAVERGNPKSIQRIADLIRNDVRLVLANPETAAIGKVVRDALSSGNQWQSIAGSAIALRTTVTEVANDVSLGAADAGIVYDAVLHTYDDLTYIELPELADAASQVSVGMIATTTQPRTALHFARYVAARDRGLVRYRAYGFRVSGGDAWVDMP